MRWIAVTAIFVAAVLTMHNAAAQSPDVTSHAAAEQDAAAAADRARAEAASQLGLDANDFSVVSVAPAQWSDSGLGCRRPGAMYAQVLTAGYAVVLKAQGKQYQISVAGNRAVLCDSAPRLTARQPMRARGLDHMTELARNDLARRLKRESSAIRIARIEPMHWTDANMNCGASSSAPAATVGYRLVLVTAGREYSYHTDLQQVRACPPVEDW